MISFLSRPFDSFSALALTAASVVHSARVRQLDAMLGGEVQTSLREQLTTVIVSNAPSFNALNGPATSWVGADNRGIKN
ncbi:MAG: hypothetical protein AAGD96_08540 [Chloroflexota bacterium]